MRQRGVGWDDEAAYTHKMKGNKGVVLLVWRKRLSRSKSLEGQRKHFYILAPRGVETGAFACRETASEEENTPKKEAMHAAGSTVRGWRRVGNGTWPSQQLGGAVSGNGKEARWGIVRSASSRAWAARGARYFGRWGEQSTWFVARILWQRGHDEVRAGRACVSAQSRGGRDATRRDGRESVRPGNWGRLWPWGAARLAGGGRRLSQAGVGGVDTCRRRYLPPRYCRSGGAAPQPT